VYEIVWQKNGCKNILLILLMLMHEKEELQKIKDILIS